MKKEWEATFRSLFQEAVERYRSSIRSGGEIFTPAERDFLKTLGATGREIFDFVEDYASDEEPSVDEVVGVTDIRRRYFQEVQGGKWSEQKIDMDRLPPKPEQLGGIAWLPRIIEKAKAKLRGQMPDDLMYGCGGDRPFLKGVNISLSEFLQFVWDVDGDRDKILKFVQERRQGKAA